MSTRFAVTPRAWTRAAALKTGCFPAPQRGVRGVSPPQGGRGGHPPTKPQRKPQASFPHKTSKETQREGGAGAIPNKPPNPPYQGGYVEFLIRGLPRKVPLIRGVWGQPPTKPQNEATESSSHKNLKRNHKTSRGVGGNPPQNLEGNAKGRGQGQSPTNPPTPLIRGAMSSSLRGGYTIKVPLIRGI